MPIVLGLASSHAPAMFSPADVWPRIHKGLTRDVPQPPGLMQETPEVLASYRRRIDAAFDALRQRLEAARPDLLVIVGDDQGELFTGACIPAIAVFIGPEAHGTTSISWIGEKPEDNHITLRNDPVQARRIVAELHQRGFDPAYCEFLQPLGKPAAGLGHAFTRVARRLGVHESGLPTVPVFLNGYHPPAPSGRRCFQLGQALRAMFETSPLRVALYASGGLSHDPLGPRAGWIDETLDRWVLECITQGRAAELQSMFATDGDPPGSGTGEIRNWITVAGALEDTRATVVDYLPAVHAVTGLGFAAWDRAT
jgi:hypothetical protein